MSTQAKAVVTVRAPTEVPVARAPDGGLLLIKREADGGFELMLRPWPTLDRVVASVQMRQSPMGVQWSPDGRSICFLARHDGPYFRPWIWIVGEEPRLLESAPPTAYASVAPAWHPASECFLYWAEGSLYSAGLEGVTRIFRGADMRAGFAWSPEGDRIAVVGVLRPGSLQVRELDGKREALLEICPGGRIRDVAWSRQGLFVAARAVDGEWYQVAKVGLSGDCVWLSDDPSDKRRPTELRDGRIAWEIHRGGEISVYSGGEGATLHTGLPYTGYQAEGWRLRFVSPGGVVAEEECEGQTTVSYPDRAKMEESYPVPVSITSADGVSIPAWLWEPGKVRGVVIHVHGAPHVAASPYHASGVRLLLEQGIAVLAINFRGSGGEGRGLEDLAGDPVEDILAARRWVSQKWPGVPTVLHGHSFGARLALDSVLRSPTPDFVGLVLVSLPVPQVRPVASDWPGLTISAFHGDWDLVAPAAEARGWLEKIANGAEVRFTTCAEEGHAFHREANKIRSYQAVVEMIRTAVAAEGLPPAQ